MIRFCLRHTIIYIDFSFLVLAALVALRGGTFFFLQLFSACLLHELGHFIVMWRLHQPVRQILFCGMGIRIQSGKGTTAYWKDFLVLLAGPLVNLTVGIGAYRLHCFTACRLHLGLCLCNLLPYGNLDGGAALVALFGMCGIPPHRAQSLQTATTWTFSAVLLFLLFHYHIHNISLYCGIFYLTLCTPLQKVVTEKTPFHKKLPR